METIRLIKNNKGDYYLIDPTKGTDANDEGFLLGSSRETNFKKLSKQNCDEIFGVVDVEKLAENKYGKGIYEIEQVDAYIEGFNKAMELNKDKVFTLEDIKKAYIQGKHGGKTQAYVEFDDYIQSLQQPTEIEVEIDMQCLDPTCDGVNRKGICIPGDNPKLDSEGCLILKKI
jgi:hypothetical protein